MSVMATQLSTEDIANVAAYFASLPGAAPGTTSQVSFPEGYKECKVIGAFTCFAKSCGKI
jgi:hypothetical protein